jgi:multidrug efflux system outer membrane protein
MRMTRHSFVAVALVVVAAGCMVGPKYQRPEVPTPAGFRGADSAVIMDSAKSIADLAWFDYFKDTTLHSLVKGALAANFDLRIATARVAEVQAQYGIAHSAAWPQVDLAAGASANQITKQQATATNTNRYGSSYGANLGLSWEVDLWGRVRSLSASAEAQYFATAEARTGVVISLIATVSQAYFDLRELDLELEISRNTLKLRLSTLQLFQNRFKGGVASGLEVAQAQGDVAVAAAAIPDLQRQIAQQENLINFLLGRGPGTIPRGELLSAEYIPPEVPAGLPSRLLERRPDVLQAEELLISANADIGVAKADYFPQISLTGLFGIASTNLSSLGNADALIASAGGSLLQPIFQGGRIDANYAATLARRDQAIAAYLKAAQNSFREVSNALIATEKTGEVRIATDSGVVALREGARLARVRYDGGLSNYLEVLDADRRLFQAELDHARAMGAQVNSYVELYRALGGGWNADTLADSLTMEKRDTAAKSDTTKKK